MAIGPSVAYVAATPNKNQHAYRPALLAALAASACARIAALALLLPPSFGPLGASPGPVFFFFPPPEPPAPADGAGSGRASRRACAASRKSRVNSAATRSSAARSSSAPAADAIAEAPPAAAAACGAVAGIGS